MIDGGSHFSDSTISHIAVDNNLDLLRRNAISSQKCGSIEKYIQIVYVADIHKVTAAFQPAVKLF